jgi:DNA primase
MVQSISKIPDAIQRSLFIQKTSQLMRLEEDVLLAEMNKLHFKKAQQKAMPTISPQNEAEIQALFEPGPEVDAPLEIQNLAYYQELECMRLLVNYGHMEISPEKAPGVSLLQYLLHELEEVQFQTPLFQGIMETCRSEFARGVIPEPSYYLHHPEEEVQRFAIDASSDKHTLSTVWRDRHEIRVKKDEELLEDFAYKNILRLRKVYNDQHIQDVMERMEKYEGDPNDMNDLLVEFIQLKEIQKNISQELGTVVEK